MGQSPNSEDYTYDVDATPFLQGNADFTDRFPTPHVYCGTAKKIAPSGALLISVRAPVGAMNEADRMYGIGRGLCAIVPSKPNLEKRYAWYVLQVTREELDTMATGSTYDAVSVEEVGSMTITLPPLVDQHAITAFLDRETTHIDTLIAKKERQIELLQEKRAALISHVVTKGLDPNVKMKDSGIEWLGEIPKHWEIAKLGYHGSVKARLGWKGLKAEEYVDEGYTFLATPNIKQKDIDFTNVNYITEERYVESPEIMLREGDVLIAKDGSTLGITNVVRGLPAPTTVNSSIAVVRPKVCFHPIFLYYVLSCQYTQNVIQKLKDGQGVPHLFQDDIRKFYIWLPPMEEQLTIATHIDRKAKDLDLLIDKVKKSIEWLHEYRTALISAAVTGKIDVRKEVA